MPTSDPIPLGQAPFPFLLFLSPPRNPRAFLSQLLHSTVVLPFLCSAVLPPPLSFTPYLCCPAHCFDLPVSLSQIPNLRGRSSRKPQATRRYRGAVRQSSIAPRSLLSASRLLGCQSTCRLFLTPFPEHRPVFGTLEFTALSILTPF